MKLLLQFNYFIFYAFLSSFLHSFGQGQDIDVDFFKSLDETNKKWLQYHSIPEYARLLQYPPHSYHLPTIVSENQSPFWDTFGDDETTDKCSDDLFHVLTNFKSGWALQMLDSDGKLSSGVTRGGLIWPGHFKECTSVYAPLDKDGHGDFHGQYCVTSWKLNLTEQYSNLPLTVGLCIPDSCFNNTIAAALKITDYFLDKVPYLKKLANYSTLDNVVCKETEKSFDAASIVYLTIISMFVIFAVLGSSITVYDNWKIDHSTTRNYIIDNNPNYNYGTLQTTEGSINSTELKIPIPENLENTENKLASKDKTHLIPEQNIEHRTVISQRPDPIIKRILLCFSIFTNGQKILNTEQTEGQLLSIHGIRFLSLTWVILGHTYITSVPIIGNKADVLKDIDTFAFQMLLQSPFSVDSFFLLSGFLVTYLFLKEATKKNGKISWLYFYIHRIWRLTPSYITVVFFYMLIFKHLGSGPFWNDNNCDADRHTWWMYFLYLNNFIDIHKMCVGWSWYLANDMQFYVISPLFLYPLWRWPKAGFAVLASILIATWTTTGIISYVYNLIPMFVGVTHANDLSAYQEKMWFSFDKIYDKPYCRIAPYIIGAILAYIIHKTGDRRNFLNWWQQLLGWTIATGCSFSVVFGLYHVEMSRTVSLFYNSLCRSTFVIGLAWLIFACETGHGGFLTKFLSWKLWIPLSRLTYSAYLVHPMLIHGYYQAYQTALHFTELVAVTNFLGFLLMSYVLAFAFSLVFESPFMNLEKLVIKGKA